MDFDFHTILSLVVHSLFPDNEPVKNTKEEYFMLKNIIQHIAIIAAIAAIANVFVPSVPEADTPDSAISTTALGDLEPPIIND